MELVHWRVLTTRKHTGQIRINAVTETNRMVYLIWEGLTLVRLSGGL